MKVFKKSDAEFAHNSSLKGYITATYNQLVNALGEPTFDTPSGDDKVQKEWIVKYKGEIFTVYDWKTYDVNYTMNRLDEFHIGGKTYAGFFISALEKKIEESL